MFMSDSTNFVINSTCRLTSHKTRAIFLGQWIWLPLRLAYTAQITIRKNHETGKRTRTLAAS